MVIISGFSKNFGLSSTSDFLIFLGISAFAIVFTVSIHRAFATYKLTILSK